MENSTHFFKALLKGRIHPECLDCESEYNVFYYLHVFSVTSVAEPSMFTFLLPLFMLMLIAGIVIIWKSCNLTIFFQTEVPSTLFNWTDSGRICLGATDRRQKYCLSWSTILIKIYLEQAF